MADKVKEVAVEEFEQARVLTRDAVKSGAYLYPIKVKYGAPIFSVELRRD